MGSVEFKPRQRADSASGANRLNMKHRTSDWENLAGEMYETLAQYQTCGAKKNPGPHD